MSDTIYVHEVTKRPGVRVSLVMDAAEVRALGDIASAAIDASLLIEGDTDSVVVGNAENVYRWATKAANTLEFTEGLRPADDKD
ncbi:MAG TPA: hypothetical protein VLJ40_11230 [Arthrobacter sp.]|nr:hypothetical protein [Arthrobacter sp.]